MTKTVGAVQNYTRGKLVKSCLTLIESHPFRQTECISAHAALFNPPNHRHTSCRQTHTLSKTVINNHSSSFTDRERVDVSKNKWCALSIMLYINRHSQRTSQLFGTISFIIRMNTDLSNMHRNTTGKQQPSFAWGTNINNANPKRLKCTLILFFST